MRFLEELSAWISDQKAIWIILAAGSLVYFNTLFNGFVWDDEEQIVANTLIHSLSNFYQIFSGATFQTGGAGLSGWFFRPFITLTFMINWIVWGGNPFGFHLFQVVFHLINAVLLFKILKLLCGRTGSRFVPLINTLLAVIFAVHPAINEAVVYIAAVSEVMFTFFILLTFWLILKNASQNPGYKLLTGSGLFLFSAMLFKESAVVGPVVIGVYLKITGNQFLRKWFTVLGLVFIAYFVLRLLIVGSPIQHPQFAPISEASIIERLQTLPSVLLHYFHLLIFPSNLAISQHFVIKNPTLSNFVAPLLICSVLIFLVGLFAYKTRNRSAVFAIFWCALSFGIISNIFPLDMTVAERWLYFPMVGVMFLFSVVLNYFSKSAPALFQVLVFIIIISMFPLGFRSLIRNTNWSDGLTLYSHDAQINSDSFDLQNNLGAELFRAGRIDEAKPHFEKSLELQPEWVYALNNLGAVYQNKGNYKKAEELYLQVLQKSDYYRSHENLSTIYTFSGNFQTAREFSQNSLTKLPNNPLLWRNLAISEYKLNNLDQALQAAANFYLLAPSPESARLYQTIKDKHELKLD